jgi:hypothetical protein
VGEAARASEEQQEDEIPITMVYGARTEHAIVKRGTRADELCRTMERRFEVDQSKRWRVKTADWNTKTADGRELKRHVFQVLGSGSYEPEEEKAPARAAEEEVPITMIYRTRAESANVRAGTTEDELRRAMELRFKVDRGKQWGIRVTDGMYNPQTRFLTPRTWVYMLEERTEEAPGNATQKIKHGPPQEPRPTPAKDTIEVEMRRGEDRR